MEKIALFFLIMFAFIGTCMVSIILHEYTHYNDFKNFNATDERLCGFSLPTETTINNFSMFITTPIAYYSYKIDINNMTPEKRADYYATEKRTEINAYTIGALIFVFYIICYIIITLGRYKDKKEILVYKYKVLDREDYINELEKYIASEK